MKNLRDPKTKIYPSTTRGGKELPSSSTLDSPSVMSKLATPTPASAIRSDMSHVIDDATSAMHDTTVPLSEFLDEQIARAREKETIESEYMMIVMMKICLLSQRVIFLIWNLLQLF